MIKISTVPRLPLQYRHRVVILFFVTVTASANPSVLQLTEHLLLYTLSILPQNVSSNSNTTLSSGLRGVTIGICEKAGTGTRSRSLTGLHSVFQRFHSDAYIFSTSLVGYQQIQRLAIVVLKASCSSQHGNKQKIPRTTLLCRQRQSCL